jgi:hypothetical protein
MRTTLAIAFGMALAALTAVPAAAQQEAPRVEVFGGYTYLQSNLLPGCNCFHVNGATGSVNFNVNDWFGLTAQAGVARTGNVRSTGLNLQVFTYQFGPRVTYRREQGTAFGHVLVGGGRASGSLYRQQLSGVILTGKSDALTLTVGGGVDVNLSDRFALRAFQADWLHTRFANGSNDRQNSFRLSTGVVFRFGGGR